eukprot:TRINITY_DN9732_c0_g1_i1.p1 TRINITY_DN9732_c0_g1~~TRINITY_DN9732_c0_g1_i1.p1  ORF type:complete len:412 (+),score=102.97 TRINITY_DN9732_c0_g1_i1:195-1430(+)
MSKDRRDKSRQSHQPLYSDMMQDQFISVKKKPRKARGRDDKSSVENVLPQDLSKKILSEVKQQQHDVMKSEYQDEENDAQFETFEYLDVEDFTVDSDSYAENVIPIDPAEEAIMRMYMNENTERRTIADIIMEKIREKEMQMEHPQTMQSRLDPKIISVYTQVSKVLKHYTSGKIPKAVKIIPMLSNWEEVLILTQPQNWSPQAVRYLTKIFASNLKDAQAQIYFEMVLLPHVREDLEKNKKLNWHLYMSLKKATYKPKAFYRGIIIPLCEGGNCTLREATIIGSIIKKVSVPALPSSVALLKISEMPYTGPTSMFVKVLIEKKYALPFMVIDSLVEYFLSFRNERRKLPVLWHQSLLSFAQFYKTDITREQKQNLKILLREKVHHQITAETRRELFNSKCRGEDDDVMSG